MFTTSRFKGFTTDLKVSSQSRHRRFFHAVRAHRPPQASLRLLSICLHMRLFWGPSVSAPVMLQDVDLLPHHSLAWLWHEIWWVKLAMVGSTTNNNVEFITSNKSFSLVCRAVPSQYCLKTGERGFSESSCYILTSLWLM